MQLLTSKKRFLGPVHLHPKTDKWDYLWSPIMKKKLFLVLTSGKFLEALGSRIGTGLVFCLSFSVSNNVWHMTCLMRIRGVILFVIMYIIIDCTYVHTWYIHMCMYYWFSTYPAYLYVLVFIVMKYMSQWG